MFFLLFITEVEAQSASSLSPLPPYWRGTLRAQFASQPHSGKNPAVSWKGKVTWLLYAFVRFDSKSVYRWCWVRVCCLDSVDPLDLRVAARLPTRLPLSEPPSMLLPPAAGVGQKWCCTLIRSGHQMGRQFYLVWLRWRFQDISRVFIFAHLQGEGL
jgi:hypothetical protein